MAGTVRLLHAFFKWSLDLIKLRSQSHRSLFHHDPMPTALPAHAATLFADFEQEFASTRRMLAAFPEGKADWKPHAKSHAMGALATHVAGVPARGVGVLTTDSSDITGRQPGPPETTAAALVALFDANAAALMAALAGSTAESLEQPWSLRAGPKVLISMPRRALVRWLVMSHHIHHRAQLSVYYRLLDVPVPGMYGPSADEGLPT